MIVIDGQFYCDVCNTKVPENEIENHKSSIEHRERKQISEVIRAHKLVEMIDVIFVVFDLECS